MATREPVSQCYLVEWYRPNFDEQTLDAIAARLNACAASISAGGMQVRLETMLAVPADEVVFGIFTASSDRLTARVCERAGLPACRIAQAHHRETPDDSPQSGP